ncbi:alpha-D-ribose 1-methylphosphonate 5-triphosphate diphosphatase [Nocardia puris]|uniref:alpha-D-ribose 1-methylphosphonate 5-triphosphate diphosphatase n=1 Tax=Nocardia puris TaxID=208602 RepID=UPI00189516B6|nr:alpha-D-ribose 1-methylphosphonate 5-triphosphate diphosphatase [Nocardia puris]MBF6213128.1 alpha-D-ribose 1-methylphosphonate 5-triphosphate diphosphatase [Nocardia puris]MBF6370057.1 alpha-D-ribose 1-methylphosphonate 5-triphosphate diphosphatase [Nocardia puris]MBF6462753.1 alpha-D-ribose 1-methylphosphonate 5-triphosphate diphosphatase [Nocardia puris]
MSTYHGVTIVTGHGASVITAAAVVIDDELGVVTELAEGAPGDYFLVPAGVDLHLDNLVERRRPRATVTLDHDTVLSALDAECAAAGMGVVCIAARCEDSPRKGIAIEDAGRLAESLERLGPDLACDWRIHARVELTDDRAVGALESLFDVSSRIAVVSMIETTLRRSRFATLDELRDFYSADWGVSPAEVEEVFRVSPARERAVGHRREQVSALAREHGVVLATHDDRSPEHIEEGRAAGATIAEFPLTMDAARRAGELGMTVVLGAPNAVRGRSTSSANLLVADAVRAGVCDVLCSDYLPSALHTATQVLAAGDGDLARAVRMVSARPAEVLGIAHPGIAVGRPLTATLYRRHGTALVGVGLWRDGRRVFARPGAQARLASRAVGA